MDEVVKQISEELFVLSRANRHCTDSSLFIFFFEDLEKNIYIYSNTLLYMCLYINTCNTSECCKTGMNFRRALNQPGPWRCAHPSETTMFKPNAWLGRRSFGAFFPPQTHLKLCLLTTVQFKS